MAFALVSVQYRAVCSLYIRPNGRRIVLYTLRAAVLCDGRAVTAGAASHVRSQADAFRCLFDDDFADNDSSYERRHSWICRQAWSCTAVYFGLSRRWSDWDW